MSRSLDVDTANFYLAVGYRLAQARHRAEMTQQQVADLVGLSRGTIANVETGGQGITLAMFANLADALSAEPTELLNGLER